MMGLRRAGVALTLVVILLALMGCTDDGGLRSCSGSAEAKLSPSKVSVQPGEKVRFKLPSEAEGLEVAWKTDAIPAGGDISQDGVFTAPGKPDLYRVAAEYTRADGTEVVANAWVSVEPPDVKPEESTAPSDGVSFSVDESSGVETGLSGNTGAEGFAGTYKGTMSLAMGTQKAEVPLTFTVDSAGRVAGNFGHAWKPEGGIQATIKATFSGTVSGDGKLTASGTATNSGTNGGQPFSSSGAISVGGKITGRQFVGGLSGSQDWKAERQ